MSFAEDFVRAAPRDERGEAQQSPADDSEDGASTDSMASCPVRGPSRYLRVFSNIVRGVFKVQSRAGADHADFVRRVKELRAGVSEQQVDDETLFLHVICTQYAGAVGTDNGALWEEWADLRGVYESGLLPRFARSRKRRHWNFELVPSDLVERAPEEAFTTRRFLEARGLGAHAKLHARLEVAAVARLREQGRDPPALPVQPAGFVAHAFQDADAALMESLLVGAMTEQLAEDARAPPQRALAPAAAPRAPAPAAAPRAPAAAPARPAGGGPAGGGPVGGGPAGGGPAGGGPAGGGPAGGGPAGGGQRWCYAPTDEDLELGLDPDERVTWNAGVLAKMGVLAMIEQSPQQARVLTSLNRSPTPDDAVMQIAMKAGMLYGRKPEVFQPQPVLNEERRRVYTRRMLPAMFAAASEMVDAYVVRLGGAATR
jgi:hypothetical protein